MNILDYVNWDAYLDAAIAAVNQERDNQLIALTHSFRRAGTGSRYAVLGTWCPACEEPSGDIAIRLADHAECSPPRGVAEQLTIWIGDDLSADALHDMNAIAPEDLPYHIEQTALKILDEHHECE